MAEDNPLASEGYILPGGLKAPPGMPPPLPNGLAPHPDLPHPLFVDQSGIMQAHDIVGPQEPVADDTPVKPSFDDTQAAVQVLPGGLKAPPDLGPPPLANGLAPHPDLPHPDFSEASREPINPMKSYAPTPLQKALPAAAAAAQPPGPDFSQAAPPVMQDQPQTMLQHTLDIYAKTGRMPLGMFTAAGIPQSQAPTSATPEEAKAYQAGQTAFTMHGVGPAVGVGGVAAATDLFGPRPTLAPEGVGGGGKAPKYSLKNPPPKTAQLPDVKALSDPFQISAHAKVEDLDAHNEPDDKYRTIFSTGSKEMKSNGQPKDAPSWRDKIVNILNANASKAPLEGTILTGKGKSVSDTREENLQHEEDTAFATGAKDKAFQLNPYRYIIQHPQEWMTRAPDLSEGLVRRLEASSGTDAAVRETVGRYIGAHGDATDEYGHPLWSEGRDRPDWHSLIPSVGNAALPGKATLDLSPAAGSEIPKVSAAEPAAEVAPEEERIVASALRYNGSVITGAHHVDTLDSLKKIEPNYDVNKVEDGFWTNKSRFVDRAEASKIAKAQGQTSQRGPINLLSEDIEKQPPRATQREGQATQGGGRQPPGPPVPAGMIRYYHGTTYPDASGFEGRTFVSPQYDYAKNYHGNNNNVLYTDIPKAEAIKRGLYDEDNGYPINGSINDGAARLKPLEGGGGRQPPEPPAPPGGGTGEPPGPPFRATTLEESIANAARQNATVHSDYLDNAAQALPSQMSSKRVQKMADDAFAISARDHKRREIAIEKDLPNLQKKLTGMFGSRRGKLDVQVYHGRESGRLLTPEEQAYNEASTVDKLHRQNTADIKELRTYNQPGLEEGLTDPEGPIMHRMRIGNTRGMDKATGVGDTVGYSGLRSLSSRPSGARKRSINALQDAEGNVKVVQEYPDGHGVRVWEKGKQTYAPGNFIRTEEGKTLPGEEIPGRTTLLRPVVAKIDKEKGLTPAYYKEPKQIPDVVRPERTTPPKQFNDKLRPGSEFIDMNNKRWTVRDATTQEIHDAGVRDIVKREIAPGKFAITYGEPVRFHESALASEMMNHLELQKALDTAKFNQKWQDSPEFKRYSVPEAEATPEQRRDWVSVPVAGWEGRYYEPRFAEPILDYVKGPGLRIPYFDKLNNLSLKSFFITGIGSIAHGRNVVWQRYLARGFGNLNLLSRGITFAQALDETLNKGKIWQDYRDKGASFPSDRLHWRTTEEQILRTLGLKVAKDPGIQAAAKRIGMRTKDFVHALEYGFGKGVFEYGDFIAFQHGLELERRGFTREQAVDRINKVFPTYRIPSRVGSSGLVGRGATKLLATRSAVAFGPFEYAKFKGLSSIVGDLLKGNIDPTLKASERFDAVGRAAALVAAITVLGPMLFDKLYQKVTGNKDAHTLFGGSIGMVARMFRAIDDIVSGRKNVVEGLLDMSSVTNWAPFTKEILQQVWNTDSFTNKPIAKPGTPDNMELALRASHAASGLFNPTMLFKDPARYLVKEPLGISEAKPFDTRPRTPRQARQEQLDQARQFRKLPSVLQGAVRATK